MTTFYLTFDSVKKLPWARSFCPHIDIVKQELEIDAFLFTGEETGPLRS